MPPMALISALLAAYISPHVPRAAMPNVLSNRPFHHARLGPISMGQPLTGSTLRAALKWQCDATGAGYAIYWAGVNGQLVMAGDYTLDASREVLRQRGLDSTFAIESERFAVDATSDDPVAKCFRERTNGYLDDATKADVVRSKLIKKYQIAQIAFVPFEDGVLEFGTSSGAETASWPNNFNLIPKAPTLPISEMRYAYELLGASYTMFWALDSNADYTVLAEHVTPACRAALKQVRGDNKTFTSESRNFKLPASGASAVAEAARDEAIVLVDDVSTMTRGDLAKEFDVSRISLVPVDGGVLEYGLPTTVALDSNLLQATLQLRADISGAAYALYWKETNGKFTVAGSMVSPARELALVKQGTQGTSYVSKSKELELDAMSIIGRCYKAQEPMFIRDAPSDTSFKRSSLAEEYGIQSIVFKPAEGGVIEYGTSTGRETVEWRTIDDAKITSLPRGELRKALADGANELLFWKRVGDRFLVRGDYVIPERRRSLRQARGDDETYVSISEEQFSAFIDVDGDSPIATAQRSGVEIVVKNAASAPEFLRKGVAKEFGVSKVHFVPLPDGSVLEYAEGSIASDGTAVSDGDEGDGATGVVVPAPMSPLAAALSARPVAPTPTTLADTAQAQETGERSRRSFLTRWRRRSTDEGDMQQATQTAAVQTPETEVLEAASYQADRQYARVRQKNNIAKLELSLLRVQEDKRILQQDVKVSRRATLVAPLATVSAISLAQYASRPEFDFPGLDVLKEAWRLQRIASTEAGAERSANLYFPGQLGSGYIDHLVDRTLKGRGFTNENTLFATSVCPDEVNSKTRELTDLLKTRYGENFALGGLGGIPFAGTAGFTAYSHHVPDDLKGGGKMFVLFAPHVGIQADGTVGKLKRPSQKGLSTACGAAIGAYKALSQQAMQAVNVQELDVKEFDAQIEFIKRRLRKGLDGIENAPDPIAFVTYQMYLLQREFFVLELKKAPAIWDFADELTVLGGIQINRAVGGDRFMPLMFQTRKKPEGSTVDLFEETFGPRADLRTVLGEANTELWQNFDRDVIL